MDKPEQKQPDERDRGFVEYVRDAWSQSLVAVNAAEDEVQKIVGKLGGFVEFGPDEGRRLAADLSEKLRRERDELEHAFEAAVRKAVAPFRLPTRDQIAQIDGRLDQLEERLDKLLAARKP